MENLIEQMALEKCYKRISELEEELKKHRWILVSERFPQCDGYYVVKKNHSKFPIATGELINGE